MPRGSTRCCTGRQAATFSDLSMTAMANFGKKAARQGMRSSVARRKHRRVSADFSPPFWKRGKNRTRSSGSPMQPDIPKLFFYLTMNSSWMTSITKSLGRHNPIPLFLSSALFHLFNRHCQQTLAKPSSRPLAITRTELPTRPFNILSG